MRSDSGETIESEQSVSIEISAEDEKIFEDDATVSILLQLQIE